MAILGDAYRLNGQFEKTEASLSRAFGHIADPHLSLAALYAVLGREEEAKAEAEMVLKLIPHFSVAVWGERNPMKDREQVKRDMEALRKAGLE